jgi:hypothetical protein
MTMNKLLPTDLQPETRIAPGLAIMFDDAKWNRMREMATDYSKSEGLVAHHLLGKPYACFIVIQMATTWNIDPWIVARNTYQTPGGGIGFTGTLILGILGRSGRFEGPIRFEHFGDWSKIRGKWKKAKSERGKDYAVADWKEEDEADLGVIVRGKVKNEVEPREFKMYLRECFPRNSTLWAQRPEQQICYTAVRAFASIAAPEILMGLPDTDAGEGMVDITPPRPRREEFSQATTAAVEDVVEEEPPPEFGHADAHELGIEWRNQNRPMSAPPELAEEFHAAFLDGWRARDNELQKAAKK